MTKNSIQCFIVLWLLLMSLSSAAQDLHFGIGGNAAYSTTRNISTEVLSPHGFSGDSFQVMPTIEHAIFGVVQYPISARLEVELGIGYSNQREDIRIYPSRFLTVPAPPEQLERNLLINNYYLHLPLQFNWAVLQNSTGELAWLNVGISNNFLIAEDNNYNSIIYERIGLGDRYAFTYQCMANAGLSKRYSLSKGHIDISLFSAVNLNRLIGNTWGFLNNLEYIKNVQLGLQLKYFFN
ncbi:MAG: hypothetical protein AB8G11_24495 [Saprospiraceae bacterium]